MSVMGRKLPLHNGKKLRRVCKWCKHVWWHVFGQLCPKCVRFQW